MSKNIIDGPIEALRKYVHNYELEKKRQDPYANFLAGGMGGLAALSIGHPFDTVKVRLQTGGEGPRPSCPPVPEQGWKMFPERVRSLYRGLLVVAATSVPR